MSALEDFRKQFKTVFRNPHIETERFRDIWWDLEFTSDLLAGPLYGIFVSGECDYVFSDHNRFPTIHDPNTFLAWCLSLVTDYRNGALKAKPESDAEKMDQATLLETAVGMERLSRLAHEIVGDRWRDQGARRGSA